MSLAAEDELLILDIGEEDRLVAYHPDDLVYDVLLLWFVALDLGQS